MMEPERQYGTDYTVTAIIVVGSVAIVVLAYALDKYVKATETRLQLIEQAIKALKNPKTQERQ